MPGRPWVLEESDLRAVRDRACRVAILPWGATEPHNLHLPYGTDSIQARAVAIEAARLAWEAGAGVVVLPTIPLGADAQQLDFPLTLNLNPSTQALVLEDVVASLERHGVAKLLVLNGHGGNAFRQIVRELQPRTEVFLCAADWYRIVAAGDRFEDPGDQAGELETSVMMHVAPELVSPLSEAGPGHARVFRLDALREGWVWAPRHWASVTEDSGVGDPAPATAEKGREYLDAVCRRLAGFLMALDAADLDDLYRDPGDD
jgi:creatinine amidohydrolase